MKWRKLGKIFDPAGFDLPNNCSEFAQSPQVLKCDGFIRTYFSTRARDSSGKYLSHVAFVDFDSDFKILNVSKDPVIGLGKLGCYDEHGVFPMNVLRDGDRVLAYMGGWTRRVSVSVDGAILSAVSRDNGLTFHRIGDGPVLTASLNEPFLVGDPFVQKYDGVFHMWYIFGTEWKKSSIDASPDRIYKIGHAVSHDGIQWEKHEEGRQIVSDSLGAQECQALPNVIRFGGRFHMYFCYRHSFDFRKNTKWGYRIGYAFSDNLRNWTRAAAGIDLTECGWDSDMQCYPHVFELGNEVFMMYNGNKFGRYGFGLAKLES